MTTNDTTAQLTSEITALKLAMQQLTAVLKDVREELQWANNAGPSYTLAAPAAENGQESDEGIPF